MCDDFEGDAPSGQDIADAAQNLLGSNSYQMYNYNDPVPSGEPKDHQFVSDVLGNAGLGFDGDLSDHPAIADWANPDSTIPGWSTVDGPPQAGDVLATAKPIPSHWYMSPGQSLGIATGDGTSIGVRDNTRIAESDFGYGDGHDPTIWRSMQLRGDNNRASALANDDSDGNPRKGYNDGPTLDPTNDPMEVPGGDPNIDPNMPIYKQEKPMYSLPFRDSHGNPRFEGPDQETGRFVGPGIAI